MLTYGRTDRHGAASCRFSQFCQHAYESLRIQDYCKATPCPLVNTYRYFENCTAFIFRVQQPSTYNNLESLTLNMKAVRSFETAVTMYLRTRRQPRRITYSSVILLRENQVNRKNPCQKLHFRHKTWNVLGVSNRFHF